MKKYHTTKEGEKMLISDMTDKHLYNTIKYIERLIIEGFEFVTGNIHYKDADIEILYGEDVELLWDFDAYIREKNKRISFKENINRN